MSDFCRIEERWQAGGVALHVGYEANGTRTLLGKGGDTWHTYDPTAPVRLDDPYEPALILRESMAREVLRALTVHYGGADDLRALRKDYEAERARVDKLIAAAISWGPS
jgi:hypothetical protein